jgi:hypothetical protein
MFCDIHDRGNDPRKRCEKCRFFANHHCDRFRTDEEDKQLKEIAAWLKQLFGELPWPIIPRKGEPIPPCNVPVGARGPCDCGEWHLLGDDRSTHSGRSSNPSSGSCG